MLVARWARGQVHGREVVKIGPVVLFLWMRSSSGGCMGLANIQSVEHFRGHACLATAREPVQTTLIV